MSNNLQTEDRSLSELIRELRDEATVLLRQEVAMAKTEMSEKASKLGRDIGTLVVGGAVAFLAAIFMLLAVTGGLAVMLMSVKFDLHAIWIAPLIVGVIVAVIAAAMIAKVKQSLASASLVPHKTIETLKDDKQWAQAKVL